MKKYLFVVFFAIALSSSTLEGQEKYVQCPVSHVTVFRQGAQLSGAAEFTVQPGTYDYVAGGLSPYIDPNSIQVRGEGDFMVMGVTHRNNYLENPAESADISSLREKIEAIDLKIEDETTATEVLLEKERFLKANYDVVTNKSTITPEQLKGLIEIYGTNMETVKSALLKKTRILKELREEKEKLEKQLAGSLDRSKMPTGEIVVTIAGNRSANGRLNLSYVVKNAGWRPSYDIRVDDITLPVNILYKANVYQSTGTEWKDVKLSFSNASPWIAGDVPKLNPWFIDYYTPPSQGLVLRGAAPVRKSDAPVIMEMDARDNTAIKNLEAVPMTVGKQVGETTVTFDVAIPYSIASDGKIQTIEIQRTASPADYKYVTIPKLSPLAYLTGEITNWAEQSLQSGEATLYFENSYVGQSFLNVNQLSDSLLISLGTDNSILVKREKQKDFTSRRVLGSNKTEIYSFLITIRNNKPGPIKIALYDQIPISSNSGISVEATELTGGQLNSGTGVVKWELEIKPQETKRVVLTYSVKYPKERTVILE